MNSSISIPGLGQLESNNPLPTSNSPIQDANPASIDIPKTDIEMVDAETFKPDNDISINSEDKKDILNDTTVIESTATKTLETANANCADGIAKHEDAETEKVQNKDLPVAVAITESHEAIVSSELQDTEMHSADDAQKQQIALETQTPASPRVTDALEAALNGLLGPAPESLVPSNEEKDAQQVTGDLAESDQVPTAEVTTAEGEADTNPEWEVDSSPYESSSSDSSDDSSDDDSDVEESKLGVEETARLLMEADGGSDDEMDGARAAKQAAGVRTKNELPDEPESKPDVRIDPEDTITPLGIVQHVVEGTQAVIEALGGGSASTILDRGSVLCKEDRTVLGVIHDTIATVHKPMYVLRFKSEEDAKHAGLEKGLQIWYPNSHAVFVFPSQLRQQKGSDASNLHDEEVGPDEVEYSDDEQEQAHKREKKNRKRSKGKFNKGDDNEPRAPAYGDPNLRYDDDEEGPYKPLQRPANFGMGLPPPPSQAVSGYPTTHGNRGSHHHGWRGDSRGRGGRGRGLNGRGRGGGGHGHNKHSSPPQPHNNNRQQPPPSFSANPPPVPGQWPFPVPPMPQFGGSPAPSNPSALNPNYPIPNWGAQPNPFPFPPVPPPNWPNTVQRPGPQANYMPPAGGYGGPAQYPANGTPAPPAPATNNYQYPNYYSGGQGQNGQSQQHWG